MTTPILKRKSSRSGGLGLWVLRLLLAACFFFGSEVLLWTDVTRAPLAWMIDGVGYVALAVLVLDLMVRFRVYELFGGMVLAGVYGLLAALLLHPAATLTDLPRTLVTRALGAQFVAGGLALALFYALLSGFKRRGPLLVVSAVGGFLWMLWVRGYPLLGGGEGVQTDPALWLVLGLCGGALATVLILWLGLRRISLPDDMAALCLSPIEWSALVVVLAGLGVDARLREALPVAGIGYVGAVLVFCLLVLWFQARPTPRSLLDRVLPLAAPSVLMGVLAAVVFMGTGLLSLQLPLTSSPAFEGIFGLLPVVISILGLVWLPAVSLVLGVRAYRYQVRTGKLL